MAGLAAIGGIIGGIASAAGSMMAAQGQAQAMEDQAEVKRAEAQAQLRKGLEESAVKQREAGQETLKRDKILSDQRAGFAASGGGIGGSARVVAEKTAQQGTYNADVSLWEGAQAMQGRQTQANINVQEADNLDRAASTTRTAGIISGVSGVFSGFTGAFKGGGGGGGGGNFFYGSSKTYG